MAIFSKQFSTFRMCLMGAHTRLTLAGVKSNYLKYVLMLFSVIEIFQSLRPKRQQDLPQNGHFSHFHNLCTFMDIDWVWGDKHQYQSISETNRSGLAASGRFWCLTPPSALQPGWETKKTDFRRFFSSGCAFVCKYFSAGCPPQIGADGSRLRAETCLVLLRPPNPEILCLNPKRNQTPPPYR